MILTLTYRDLPSLACFALLVSMKCEWHTRWHILAHACTNVLTSSHTHTRYRLSYPMWNVCLQPPLKRLFQHPGTGLWNKSVRLCITLDFIVLRRNICCTLKWTHPAARGDLTACKLQWPTKWKGRNLKDMKDTFIGLVAPSLPMCLSVSSLQCLTHSHLSSPWRKRQLQFLLEGRGRRAGLSPEELRDNGKLLGEGLSRALFNYPSRDCSADSPEVRRLFLHLNNGQVVNNSLGVTEKLVNVANSQRSPNEL